jgi:hypothetical protein
MVLLPFLVGVMAVQIWRSPVHDCLRIAASVAKGFKHNKPCQSRAETLGFTLVVAGAFRWNCILMCSCF